MVHFKLMNNNGITLKLNGKSIRGNIKWKASRSDGRQMQFLLYRTHPNTQNVCVSVNINPLSLMPCDQKWSDSCELAQELQPHSCTDVTRLSPPRLPIKTLQILSVHFCRTTEVSHPSPCLSSSLLPCISTHYLHPQPHHHPIIHPRAPTGGTKIFDHQSPTSHCKHTQGAIRS